VRYQTLDATAHLHSGENLVTVTLAPGWYSGHVGWFGDRVYGGAAMVSVDLDVASTEGSRVRLTTDETWWARAVDGDSADLLMGEHKTITELPPEEAHAVVAEPPAIMVEAQEDPPIRAVATVEPISVERVGSDHWLVDLGQNVSGWLRIDTTSGGGHTVTVDHAEALYPDGRLYTENLRTAAQRDTYRLRRAGPVRLEPAFTIHGFRHALVGGLSEEPAPGAIVGRVVHTDLEKTGEFACSDPELVRLHENIVRSQAANSVGIPTDCPQRDERLGWLGDMEAFTRTAAFNMNVRTFLRGWLRAIADGQAADGAVPDVAPFHPRFLEEDDEGDSLGYGASGWADAIVSVPWDLYLMYGDRSILEELWTPMLRWVAFMRDRAVDGIYTTPRYGDWLGEGPETSAELIGTAYYAR
jgi:alpha-L-rhamnosidase